MRKTAVLLESIHPSAAEIFKAAGYLVRTHEGSLEGEALIEGLRDADVIGIRSATRITKETIEAAPNLEAIGAYCIGTNQIELDAAAAHGIAVFNAPYANTRSVVELTAGEMVMLARRIPERSRQMHDGIWQKSASSSYELRGKTLGIVGYGNIGSQLSVLAEAMGMRVVFYDANDKLALGNARPCMDLSELLEQSDVVTLHVDGRERNTHMIGKDQFAQMKPGALFINNSRGHVVDIEALAEACRTGHIAGAAADVFENEPGSGDTFSSPLQGIPNVILTPHIGGATREAQENIGRYTTQKLLRYMSTGDSTLSVNVPSLSLPPRENSHRLLYVHRNVPGALANINDMLKDAEINIAGQLLATHGEIGYVIIDSESIYGDALLKAIAKLEESIKVRVIQAQ